MLFYHSFNCGLGYPYSWGLVEINWGRNKKELWIWTWVVWLCVTFISAEFLTAGVMSSSGTQGQSVGSGEKARRKFSSTGERAPGYRLSPNYFQKFKRMLAPDWAQKMVCIIVPHWRTVSPEFFSWVRTRRDSYCLATLARFIHQACAGKGTGNRFFYSSVTFGML